MANRHKAFKKGGKVAYDAEKSNVMKEAKKKKSGGKVETRATGGAAPARLDRRARGGGVGPKAGGSGKDMTKSPFSAAHVRTNGDA